ncbi:cytochrome P450 714C2-like isoform X1 [Fagus crenata]
MAVDNGDPRDIASLPTCSFCDQRGLGRHNIQRHYDLKGINVQIPIPILQRHCDLWGSDAHKFNPERFAHGIVGACKTPQAYLPFGVGSCVCADQHFAMTELKVILSLILSKFCFSLSPAYHHSPSFRLVIVLEHGVTLRVRKA